MPIRILLVAAVLLSACQSEPQPVSRPAASPTPVPAPSPTPEPGPTATDEPACTDATITGQVVVRVTAGDFSFGPDCLVVLGGQTVTVRNAGVNTHNFTIDRSPIGFDVSVGQVERTGPIGGSVPPGTYRFYCVYHRSRGMEGEITVSAAG